MPDCLGTLSSTLCQILISAFKEVIGKNGYDKPMFLKWARGILMTLVVPSLDNIFMVLLMYMSALGNLIIGAKKCMFLDSGSPRREGVCVHGMVCYNYHCIVHVLNSRKNSMFFVSNSNLRRAMLPNFLRTYFSALCQIRTLAFKKYKQHWLKCTQNRSWF